MASNRQGARFSASTTRSAAAGASNNDGNQRSSARLENTYQTEPKSEFPCRKVKTIIDEVLDRQLQGKTYNPQTSNGLTLELASAVKSKVQALSSPRYKVTVFVILGQNKLSSINFASRCAWNEKHDTFVEHHYHSGSMFAVILVYGVYQE